MMPKLSLVVVVLSGFSLLTYNLSEQLSFAIIAIWLLLAGIYVNGIRDANL